MCAYIYIYLGRERERGELVDDFYFCYAGNHLYVFYSPTQDSILSLMRQVSVGDTTGERSWICGYLVSNR